MALFCRKERERDRVAIDTCFGGTCRKKCRNYKKQLHRFLNAAPIRNVWGGKTKGFKRKIGEPNREQKPERAGCRKGEAENVEEGSHRESDRSVLKSGGKVDKIA